MSSKARERYITGSLSRVYLANQFGENLSAPELLTVNGFHRAGFPDPEASMPMTRFVEKKSQTSLIDRIDSILEACAMDV